MSTAASYRHFFNPTTSSLTRRRCLLQKRHNIINHSNNSTQRRNFVATRVRYERLSRQVNARGVTFHIEQLHPKAPNQILCLAGALGTAMTDFEVQLNNNGGIINDSQQLCTNNKNNGINGEDDDSFQFGLVAIDPRGLGGSTAVTTTGETFARDYPANFYLRDALDGAAVMSALGHDTYSVMGWSDGANAAIHLAAHKDLQDVVHKLIIWGGNAYVTEEDIQAYESVRDVSKSWSIRMRNDKANVHGGVDALQILNDKYTDAMRDIMYQRGGDICLAELHRITCPTLVLHGSLDVICHEKHARYIARHIPNSKLDMIPHGKHNVHMKHADEFHRIVRKFLVGDESISVVGEAKEKEVGHNYDDKDVQPDIDQIAYGFMGSKALFTALRAGIFDAIDLATDGSKPGSFATFDDIETSCDGIHGERLRTLLSACVALKLIRRRIDEKGGDLFHLPKASSEQLCRSSRRYWGDYLSMQVDGQFYNRLADIDDTMRTGTQASHGYESWFAADPDAAMNYTQAQHNGSLATAYALHKRLPDLAKDFPSMRMLDVGGGSGAFSIVAARKIPDATAVVLDLPNVIETAKDIILEEEESVSSRVSTLALSATDPGSWDNVVEDESFDVVLMSYVSGSIPFEALPGLYENAFRALRPGGVAVIHDFFVNNDGKGPLNSSLWALAHVSVNPEGMGLVPRRVINLLSEQGFIAPRVHDLIPGMTQVVVAKKKS